MAYDDTERPEPTCSGVPSCAADPAASDWPELPAPLRARLAEIAGTALGGLPPGDVPTPLRRFARFTPAKRARLGGQVLVARLQQDTAFRAAVVAWWAENRPGELELPEPATTRPAGDPPVPPGGPGASTGDTGAAEAAGPSGRPAAQHAAASPVDGSAPAAEAASVADPLPAPVDKLDAAAVALLTADPLAHRRVAEVGQTADLANLRAERDEALAKVDKLTAELERARAELVEERERARALVGERETEYQQMRRRVSDQGARLRAALDARTELEEEVARLRGGVDDELARSRAETAAERERADRERRRADAAAGQVAAARQAAREARRGDEVRLELLLDTVSGAISGLRRELDVGAGGPRPADLVAGTGDRGTGARVAAPVDGLAALDALLTVPSVHLIVDGYNVSKTGYPDLPLADQRSRLVAQLGALGARTGAEITVVFDGAAVIAAPVRGSRGVRVLFSDAGVIADDVVRDLVAAEPAGRPLLVATSDQEIVRSVRRRGAHTVASAVLLRRLGG
ncbi:NYN domain-containing protein [Pseudonocardia alni]|uniref:NYN domain-containing protein n=1 Tax=Pseudonocardia alni subsp. carboxydivorans TaxID=415010 RepID=A0ABU9AGD5_PSEA5